MSIYEKKSVKQEIFTLYYFSTKTCGYSKEPSRLDGSYEHP